MPEEKDKPTLSIGQPVTLKANRTNGTIVGQWRERDDDWKYKAEYVSSNGVIHESWFSAREIADGHDALSA